MLGIVLIVFLTANIVMDVTKLISNKKVINSNNEIEVLMKSNALLLIEYLKKIKDVKDVKEL